MQLTKMYLSRDLRRPWTHGYTESVQGVLLQQCIQVHPSVGARPYSAPIAILTILTTI